MFNPTEIVITAFIRELREMYDRNYGTLEPGFPGVISFVAQLALENIATSDAPYHDVNHTIMVTLVGQELRAGQAYQRGWRNAARLAVLHHIATYVTTSAMCAEYAKAMKMAGMSPTWPEIRLPYRKAPLMASLTPSHVVRSKLFIRTPDLGKSIIDPDIPQIERNIEHTRFLVPEDDRINLRLTIPAFFARPI